MINAWYIAAVIFTALAAYSAYYGSVVHSRRSAEEQNSRIEAQLESLGQRIQDLRIDSKSEEDSTKIDEIDERYRQLAEEFFESIELRAAKEESRTAQEKVAKIQKIQKLEAHLREIEKEARELAEAYNESSDKISIKIESNTKVENLHGTDPENIPYILLNFEDSRFWGIRVVSYPNRTIALQFVRLVSPENSLVYQQMRLTDDSINIVLLEDKFTVSLNAKISEAIKANIADKLTLNRQSIDKLTGFSAELTRLVIEYELLSIERR